MLELLVLLRIALEECRSMADQKCKQAKLKARPSVVSPVVEKNLTGHSQAIQALSAAVAESRTGLACITAVLVLCPPSSRSCRGVLLDWLLCMNACPPFSPVACVETWGRGQEAEGRGARGYPYRVVRRCEYDDAPAAAMMARGPCNSHTTGQGVSYRTVVNRLQRIVTTTHPACS